VGKRVGRARAGMREERSDDRSPAKALRGLDRNYTRIPKKKQAAQGRPVSFSLKADS